MLLYQSAFVLRMLNQYSAETMPLLRVAQFELLCLHLRCSIILQVRRFSGDCIHCQFYPVEDLLSGM
ncbi:hypothetical protein BSAE_1785 [Bifidobacterium pullorum subsp. saeculare DSM 6531 = LMG 14934]|uniref:Uncharacterized protein n=1 Tax=Bifidobacterium pullorum subsp. saeculare DSM 6531 = LMG 14934 TaxID=1437611 RepID=A0A087CXZ8_9BIFI|nr:hypothetical protein BSAE_1785 [Bifidobacterium pullorum subsp. saeculare DSM 6531 = LMG 14934]